MYNNFSNKELQETGLYDYGWRQYMPDIGRWNAMDQLAEMYAPISPYAYVANNPISFIDPDGRKIEENENGWTFTGNDINLLLSYFNNGGEYKNLSSQLEGYGSDFGSGPISNFWSSFNSGGIIGGVNVSNGWVRWISSYGGSLNGNHSFMGYTTYHNVQIRQDSFNSWMDGNNNGYYGWTGFNGVLGTASGITTWKSGSLQYNELWHKTKTRGYSFATQKRWKSNMAKQWRADQTKGFQNAKNFGKKLRVVGGVAVAADIAMSGEIKPSHLINGGMLVISGTGIGSIVAGAWFIADYGTMGVNYLLGNGVTGLGDMLDQSSLGQSFTIDMYDGLY